jgi:hypothetical protein
MPGQRPGPFLVVVGLTDDQTLVAFASTNPTKLTTLGPITGLTGDQRLIGLDCRVSDSTAYGRSHRHPPPGVTVADTALTIPPGHRGHQRGDRVGLQQRR